MKLKNFIRRIQPQLPCAVSTAGWKVPPTPEELMIEIIFLSLDDFEKGRKKRNLPLGTKAYIGWDELKYIGLRKAWIYMTQLETVEDLELLRHELRHAYEGHWHD